MQTNGAPTEASPSVMATISLTEVGEQASFRTGLTSQKKCWITFDAQKVSQFTRRTCRREWRWETAMEKARSNLQDLWFITVT